MPRIKKSNAGKLSIADMRKLINSTTDLGKYHLAAEKQGMRSLRTSGAQKIAEGLTTMDEIYSVIPPQKEN